MPESDGGAEYDIRVRAVNSADKASDWATTTVTVTPKAAPDPPPDDGEDGP